LDLWDKVKLSSNIEISDVIMIEDQEQQLSRSAIWESDQIIPIPQTQQFQLPTTP